MKRDKQTPRKKRPNQQRNTQTPANRSTPRKNYELREELRFTKKELNTTKTYLNKILTLLDQMGIDIQVALETHETFKEPDV